VQEAGREVQVREGASVENTELKRELFSIN
jgi:hypothetical protein